MTEDDKLDDIIKMIYVNTDELFKLGRFDLVDALLNTINVEKQPVVLMLTWLTATFCAAEKLPARRDLYYRIAERLFEIDPTRAPELLKGLDWRRHVCACGALAVWWYMPATDRTDIYFCEDHVPRGCSCNRGYVHV